MFQMNSEDKMRKIVMFTVVCIIFAACGSNERKELYEKAVNEINLVLESPSTALLVGYSNEDTDSLMITEIKDSTNVVIVKMDIDLLNEFGSFVRTKAITAFRKDTKSKEWKPIYATLLD
jgi:hypothetical protein